MAETTRFAAPRPIRDAVGDDRMAKARRLGGEALYYLMLLLLMAIFVAPLIWMTSSSLKPEGSVFEYPPRLIAERIQWWNYSDAWAQFPFWRSLGNTMTITMGVLAGRLLSASLTAFAFARLRFRGRGALFVLALSTMMIPYQVTLIPQFLLFRQLGWLDSMKPLTVPAFFGDAFSIFLLRQFFMGISNEMEDAARIDGCSLWDIYWRIILPLSKPALGTLAIFHFMWVWNDFLAPLIYLNTGPKQTLMIHFMIFENLLFSPEIQTRPYFYSHVMAVATLIALPPILVFFFTQRYFIQGIVTTGVKG